MSPADWPAKIDYPRQDRRSCEDSDGSCAESPDRLVDSVPSGSTSLGSTSTVAVVTKMPATDTDIANAMMNPPASGELPNRAANRIWSRSVVA